MLRHVVTALKTVSSPAGPVLDRFSGPGWTATPDKMLELLRSGGHVFQLADTNLELRALREGDGGWAIAVVGPDGQRVQPTQLPHWELDRPRPTGSPQKRWWQKLLDPDAR